VCLPIGLVFFTLYPVCLCVCLPACLSCLHLQLQEELGRSRDVTRELRLRVTKLEGELEAARASLAAAAGAGGAAHGGSKGGYRRPAAADRCAVPCFGTEGLRAELSNAVTRPNRLARSATADAGTMQQRGCCYRPEVLTAVLCWQGVRDRERAATLLYSLSWRAQQQQMRCDKAAVPSGGTCNNNYLTECPADQLPVLPCLVCAFLCCASPLWPRRYTYGGGTSSSYLAGSSKFPSRPHQQQQQQYGGGGGLSSSRNSSRGSSPASSRGRSPSYARPWAQGVWVWCRVQ
jgi:hypothetical protein